MSGKAFTEKLLPVDGAVPFLYELGFGESSDGEFIEVKERGDVSSIFDPGFLNEACTTKPETSISNFL